jgi:hypothetical protein
MQVYTFSTGGCRDGYYLDKLSTTKDGVKELLKPYIKEWYLDNSQVIKNIVIDFDTITVVIYDNDLEETFNKQFELIIFDCL